MESELGEKVNKFKGKVIEFEGEIGDKFGEEIRKMAREMVEKLIQIRFYKREGINEQDRGRVKRILEEAEKKKEIVEFLSLEKNKLYRDFVVIMIKGGKYVFFNLKIKSSEIEAREYRKKQEELKMEFIRHPFIESVTLVVNPQKSDKELEKDWQKILKQLKES
jgi:hypothetical protein